MSIIRPLSVFPRMKTVVASLNKVIVQRRYYNWQVLTKLVKMDVKVNKDGTKATVTLPALHFSDFDRSGKLSVRNIQNLLTMARIVAYHTHNPDTGTTFIEYDKVTSDRFTFMASTKTSYDRSLFDLTRRQSLKQSPNLAIEIHLGYVGTSSLNSVATLFCRDTNVTYASNINQVVMVDKSTRKPTTIPTWWKDKYVKQADGQPLKIALIPVPERVHLYDIKVAWSDIDQYKHTNYVSYIRYCEDAAMDACVAGFFSKVKEDFQKYCVQCMEVSYKGESVANDLLSVHVWENEENPFMVHFSITKNGSVIFQNTMTLFEP